MDRSFHIRPLVITTALASFAIAACLQLPAQGDPPPGNAVAEAAPLQPTARDRRIARMISMLMPRYHVSTTDLDDTISQRALNLYLDRFDPLKLYFNQSDVDEFSTARNKIDDTIREGDLSLAYRIFDRFTARVDERVRIALELLDGDFDFTKDDFIVVDADVAKYARNTEEVKDRWRRQLKYALLDLQDDDTIGEEAKDLLRRRYQRYARRFKNYDNDDILEAYLTSITSAFDPHST
ncbi:MAG: hypothetical protein AAF802_21695, partial [Planctomycetota bacterium]